MAGRSSKTGVTPGWYDPELPHVWLPYAQMKTVSSPLPVARTEGARIFLADGRELIDGIASWWTACHGYNHPHIRQAIETQLASMPHVMFGGLVHEQALRLAGRLAAAAPGRSGAGIFLRLRIGGGRDRHEDGDAVLDQPRGAWQKTVRRFSRRVSRRHARRDVHQRSGDRHACRSCRRFASASHRRFAGRSLDSRDTRKLVEGPKRYDRRHYCRAIGAGCRRDEIPRRRRAASSASPRGHLRRCS